MTLKDFADHIVETGRDGVRRVSLKKTIGAKRDRDVVLWGVLVIHPIANAIDVFLDRLGSVILQMQYARKNRSRFIH